MHPTNNEGFAKLRNFHYCIPDSGQDVAVCRKFFLGILQISWGRLYRVLTKKDVTDVLDKREKASSVNKIDDFGVIAHISSFPSYQSHYTRKNNPDTKYLHPDLNIRKMYDLYVEKCVVEQKSTVKKKYYYHVFSSKFNLRFKPPSKDTCKSVTI